MKQFTFDKQKHIDKDNIINYCKFLLKHKGKLHNTFGIKMYKVHLKDIQNIIDTEIIPDYFLFYLDSIRFMFRYKYDKKIKHREIDYKNGKVQKRYKEKCKLQYKQIHKLKSKLNL